MSSFQIKNNEYKINWDAYWIWLDRFQHRENCYIGFRKQFELPKTQGRIVFHISAFTHYQLFLNGKEIGHGPNPALPGMYYYDSYDVTTQCVKGINTIAVHAYNFAYRVEHDSTYAEGIGGGLIFQAEINDAQQSETLLVSDSSWKARLTASWQKNTPRYVLLRHGNKEYVDGRKGVLDFISPSFDDTKWANTDEQGKHPMEPFSKLIPREIKNFQKTEIFPVNATSIGFNYAYGMDPVCGWGEIDDPLCLVKDYPKGSHEIMLQGGESNGADDNKQKLLDSNCHVQIIKGGENPSIIFDFGQLCVGRFQFEIEKADPGIRIDIAYGEQLNLTYVDRYITCSGKQNFSPYHRRVARYVMLTFRNAPKSLILKKVSFLNILYPTENRGYFKCSDKLLNRIWQVSRKTIHLCMGDHFEDCPWREQKLYAGDMYVQATATSYAFPDLKYIKKSLRQIGMIPPRNGWLIPFGPGNSEIKSMILEFPALYIISLLNYYNTSSDINLIRELYPKIKMQLETYMGINHTQGLIDIGTKGGFDKWCFINWGNVHKQGVVTALNILVAQALKCGAKLASIIGQTNDSRFFQRKSEVYFSTISKLLWDNEKTLYIDCLVNGKKSRSVSIETNSLALLFKCGSKKQLSCILHSARKTDRWLTKTGFFNTFILESLFKNEQHRQALETMRFFWGNMIRRGADTFWESFDYETPGKTLPHKLWSLCHGWSASPIYLIGAYILGITPTSPGFHSAKIKPYIIGIEFGKGKVPTPKGDIEITWNKDILHINVPKSISAKIELEYCKHIKRVFLNGKEYQNECIST